MAPEMHEDQLLFETLVLEGMAAGLNRKMVQNKKAEYRKAFENFDPKIVASYTEEDIERLMQDKSIIRNFRKLSSVITNAQAFVAIQQEYGSFDTYIWGFINGKPQEPDENDENLPGNISKALKKKGFKFVGPTSLRIFMYVTGMQQYTPDKHVL